MLTGCARGGPVANRGFLLPTDQPQRGYQREIYGAGAFEQRCAQASYWHAARECQCAHPCVRCSPARQDSGDCGLVLRGCWWGRAVGAAQPPACSGTTAERGWEGAQWANTTSPCITLHHPASRCITLHHTTSPYITLHHPASSCITHHPASPCTTLHHPASFSTLLHPPASLHHLSLLIAYLQPLQTSSRVPRGDTMRQPGPGHRVPCPLPGEPGMFAQEFQVHPLESAPSLKNLCDLR